MKLKTLVTVVGAFLIASLLLGFAVMKSEKGGALREADRARLVRMHSPTVGRAEAPVVIVEFLDPACGTCRDFYPFVKQLMAQSPERIRLVVRYAPFHRNSDQVVAMLEAARRQGRFWPALEALLETQDDWVVGHVAQPERAWRRLQGLGLDLARLRADAASAEVAQTVRQDLDDAIALQVTKTPEFFVNARPMPRFGYDELRALVQDALASAR